MDRTLPKDDARDKLPEREGTLTFATESPKIVAAVPERRYALSELASTFSFFNIGLFFSAGRLDRDPVADYWIRSGLPMDERPGLYELDHQPFGGLGANDRDGWGRDLWIVPAEHRAGLYDYLRAVGVVDWATRTYWRAEPRDVVVMDSATNPKPITVSVFQVFRNDASFVVDQVLGPHAVVARRLGPAPSVVLFAESLFGESETPFRALEPDPASVPHTPPPEISELRDGQEAADAS